MTCSYSLWPDSLKLPNKIRHWNLNGLILRQLKNLSDMLHAAGLFIWAKAVMDFMRMKGSNPVVRSSSLTNDFGKGANNLDALYHHILSDALKGLTPDERDAFDAVVAAIVLAKNPLCYMDLQNLLQMDDILMDPIIHIVSLVISITEV